MKFAAAILTGGASRRMGSDKALLVVNGRPLVQRIALVLEDAGASSVTAVGGDVAAMRALAVAAIPDAHPGDGPLGGILTALANAGDNEPIVAVVACDLPWLTGEAIRALVDALTVDLDAAVACIDGRRQPVVGAWRRSASTLLRAAFDAGERSPLRALDTLRVAEVTFADPRWGRDADWPSDLDV